MWRGLLFLLIFLTGQGFAAPLPVLLVPLHQGQVRSVPDRQSFLATVAQRRPSSLVLLVHGYNVMPEDSRDGYQKVAQAVQALDPRVLVIGIQWDSAAPGGEVPWQAEDAYFAILRRSREVGRQGFRQLLLDVGKRFPQMKVAVVSHSLGCEVAASALYPQLNDWDDARPDRAAYQSKAPLNLVLWGLMGSDLDYDIWWKSKLAFPNPTDIGLHWMTISSYQGERDQTLLLRKVSRGFAGGSALPRMTPEQWDFLMARRRLLFDGDDLDESHDFLDYLSPTRLKRMLRAAGIVPGGSLELAELNQVLKAPGRVEVLRPWLDQARLAPQMYALWRLEKLLCGGSQHFSDQTLENVARLLRNTPIRVRQERADSPCQTVKQGIWPTEKQLIRAGAPAW